MESHDTCCFQHNLTGSWGSAVRSAPAAEDFLRTKHCSAASEKEPHELSEGFVCEITGVCWQDVCPRWSAEMIFPKLHGSEYLYKLHWLAFGLLHSSVSPQYYNSGFRCPTCRMVTSFLSLTLMMETWMLSDVGGPALMFISPNIWVRYLVAGCRCMCPD